MPKFKGTPVQIDTFYNYNVETGPFQTSVHRGTRDYCFALYRGAISRNNTATLSRVGGDWIVTVLQQATGGPLASKSPMVNWDHAVEQVEKSWFTIPAVQTEAENYISVTTDLGPAAYKRDIEQGVKDGLSRQQMLDVYGFTSSSFAILIYTQLMRGIDTYQDEYNVVRRTIDVPLWWDFSRTIIRSNKVYTTEQIGLPSDIWDSIEEPDALSETVVGWRVRSQNYSRAGGRRQEVIEWVLAAWPTLAYSAAGGNFS